MKEIRNFISVSRVRHCCINHGWFNCGYIDEYYAFFDYIHEMIQEGGNVDTYRLTHLAKVIKENSQTESNIHEIMFFLNRDCCFIWFDYE